MAERSYRLIVEGEFSDIVGLTFHGMSLTSAGGNTSLTGRVRDQSELRGLLGACRTSCSSCSTPE